MEKFPIKFIKLTSITQAFCLLYRYKKINKKLNLTINRLVLLWIYLGKNPLNYSFDRVIYKVYVAALKAESIFKKYKQADVH